MTYSDRMNQMLGRVSALVACAVVNICSTSTHNIAALVLTAMVAVAGSTDKRVCAPTPPVILVSEDARYSGRDQSGN